MKLLIVVLSAIFLLSGCENVEWVVRNPGFYDYRYYDSYRHHHYYHTYYPPRTIIVVRKIKPNRPSISHGNSNRDIKIH